MWNIKRATYDDTPVPGEDSQFIESCNKVPPRGDVARDEDPKSEDGKRVHESKPLVLLRSIDYTFPAMSTISDFEKPNDGGEVTKPSLPEA